MLSQKWKMMSKSGIFGVYPQQSSRSRSEAFNLPYSWDATDATAPRRLLQDKFVIAWIQVSELYTARGPYNKHTKLQGFLLAHLVGVRQWGGNAGTNVWSLSQLSGALLRLESLLYLVRSFIHVCYNLYGACLKHRNWFWWATVCGKTVWKFRVR